MLKKLPLLFYSFLFLFVFFSGNILNAKTIKVVAGPTPDAKGILYVKTGGTGDGSSWSNALGELRTAVESTNSAILQIWVAAGTYTPMYGKTFLLKRDIKIYGGFTGTENDIQQRDLKTNITILKGLSNTIIKTEGLTEVSVLDGFTMIDGFTDYNTSGTPGFGGAISNRSSSLTISNCIFKDNKASSGGAIYSFSGYPKIKNCTFINHKSNTIYNDSNSALIADCTFEKNMSLTSAIKNEKSVVEITNCNFTENKGEDGGAVYNERSTVTFTNCNFSNNISSYGSSGNNGGGAIFNAWISTIKIYNCSFVKNSASRHGGAIVSNNYCNVLIVNSIFANNSAKTKANEIYSTADNTLNIINSTFVNAGEDAITLDSGSVNFTNCIVWTDINIDHSSTYTSKNSIILGKTDSTNGNLDATGINDTQIFKNPSTEDYTLPEGGIAINKGNNSLYDSSIYGTLDLSGKTRINETVIDLGAYEFFNGSLGIEDTAKPTFIAYPNPVKGGIFTIENSATDGIAVLYDISGKQVKMVKIENGKAEVNITNLPKGIYLLKTFNGKAFKIIVE
ncbi:right-handed parallel beta-helix repeat-containing protein [Flavobacterium sp. CLA17]|uniref:right-handed parallel beta-helix repeat-containing protein n=1 Tax=Flavobacterium sp. CLA17 TaxID=2724135 RepID=UPI001490BFE8|nr:right-handed parallel beta-helix repeat-containing protein [Flavobacterium sp. CLA17]QSB26132.1 T9SS type A sorting domain-containing protein [Flavobacterium sp. CLA17]